MGSEIDWDAWRHESRAGRFLELIMKLPHERWAEAEDEDDTLIHIACIGPNVKAVYLMLKNEIVNKNAQNEEGETPAHITALYGQCDIMELLLALGANMRLLNKYNHTVLDYAIERSGCVSGHAMVYLLLANGLRLSMVHTVRRFYITPEMIKCEESVLRCRAAVVSMLRVKRAGKLWQWDKYLLREIGYAIWATRYECTW
jgi:ankyrin repeat protein